MSAPRGPRRHPGGLAALVAVGVAVVTALAGCTSTSSAAGTATAGGSAGTGSAASGGSAGVGASPGGSPAAGSSGASGSPASAAATRKVMVIAEENESYARVIGASSAPYINSLARTFGLATAMDAGYPGDCPSLAAYLLLTSGDREKICDDGPPGSHQLSGDSIFSQVVATGRQWRGYAESMPANCTLTNSEDGLYLVRHAPAPYYLRERAHCRSWDVPLGTLSTGHLHDDLAAGALPAYSFVTPDACNDMHGAAACTGPPVATGDAWLKRWIPAILAGPDYTSGRLVILIVWDEGTVTNNHIPAVVISPGTRQLSSATRWTHCSTLRTAEELLGLPLLGCAATTTSMAAAFGLARAG